MSFEDERVAVEAKMAAEYSSTTVQYENIPFSQPTDTAWVSLTILSGGGNVDSIGSGTGRLERFSGVIQIDIYVPEDGGTKAARDIADLVHAIFDNKQFSSGSSGTITTRVPSYSTLGVEGGWHHSVVSVAYHRSKFS